MNIQLAKLIEILSNVSRVSCSKDRKMIDGAEPIWVLFHKPWQDLQFYVPTNNTCFHIEYPIQMHQLENSPNAHKANDSSCPGKQEFVKIRTNLSSPPKTQKSIVDFNIEQNFLELNPEKTISWNQ